MTTRDFNPHDALIAAGMAPDVRTEVALGIVEQRFRGLGFGMLPLINGAHQRRYEAILGATHGCDLMKVRGYDGDELYVVMLVAGHLALPDVMGLALNDGLDAVPYVTAERCGFLVCAPATVTLGNFDPLVVARTWGEACGAPRLHFRYPPSSELERDIAREHRPELVTDRQRDEVAAIVEAHRTTRRLLSGGCS